MNWLLEILKYSTSGGFLKFAACWSILYLFIHYTAETITAILKPIIKSLNK